MSRATVTIRIDFDRTNAIGPGKIALLEQMRDCGSLTQAARELGMSYKRAWQLLDALNRSFKTPLVLTAVGGSGGGGSTLTPLGEEVVSSYRALERETNERAAKAFANLAAAAVRASVARRSISRSVSQGTPPKRAARSKSGS